MKYSTQEGYYDSDDASTLAGGPEPRTPGVKDGLFYPFLKHGSKFAALVAAGGESRHVFYQSSDGSLHEATYDNPTWTTRQILPKNRAMMGTPIAATCWPGNDNGVHIRVYFLSQAFNVHEVCFEGGDRVWFDGELGGENFGADGGSGLGAACYKNGSEIRVYYQSDNTLRELVKSHGHEWCDGHAFTQQLLPNSPFSFVNLADVISEHPSIRGYYQDTQGSIKEVCIDSGTSWFDGAHIEYLENTSFLTPITATTCIRRGGTHISVFYLDRKGRIVQKVHDNGEWLSGFKISRRKVVAGGGIAASCFGHSSGEDVEIQCYANVPLNCLAQFVYRNEVWDGDAGVYGGGVIPVGMVMAVQMVDDGRGDGDGEGGVGRYGREGGVTIPWRR